MNKIRVIELLNMISRGEEVPKKIEYCRTIFYYDDNGKDYISIANEFNEGGISICKYIFSGNLNTEVEIIEEDKKIEKFKEHISIFRLEDVFETLLKFKNKINEIIDVINKGDK